MSMSREVTSRTIASVLAGIILAGIWFFWDSVKPVASGAWFWLRDTAVACVMWFFDRVYMQRWFFLLLLGVTLLVIVRRILLYALNRSPRESTPADFVEFKRFGIVWRWQWHLNAVTNLNGYCPQCGRLLRYREDMRVFHPEPTEFFCTNCSGIRFRRDGHYSQSANDVLIEIDHAIRSGEWKRLVSGGEVVK